MEIFLILTGIIFSLSAEIFYIRQIYLRKIRPSLSAFVVFFLSTGLGGLSSLVYSLGWESLISLSFASLHLVMLTVAWKVKQHAGWDKIDTAWVGLALFSAAAWLATNQAIYGLLTALFIDFIGYCALLLKQKRLPAQESLFAWAAAGIAYSLTVATPFLVGTTVVWESLLFPVLNVVGCLSVLVVDFWQKKKAPKE